MATNFPVHRHHCAPRLCADVFGVQPLPNRMGPHIPRTIHPLGDPASARPICKATYSASGKPHRCQAEQSRSNCLIDLIAHLLHLQRIANPRLRPLYTSTERVIARADEVRADALLGEADLGKRRCGGGSSVSEQRLNLLIGCVTRAIKGTGAASTSR